jgi:hypothetical protein
MSDPAKPTPGPWRAVEDTTFPGKWTVVAPEPIPPGKWRYIASHLTEADAKIMAAADPDQLFPMPMAGTVRCPGCSEAVPVLVPGNIRLPIGGNESTSEFYEWLSKRQQEIGDACCYHEQLQHYPRAVPIEGGLIP